MPDTGSPYFLPYPDLTDEADAPAFFAALASAEHNGFLLATPRSSRFKTTPQALPVAGTHYPVLWDSDETGLGQVNSVLIPYNAATGVWTFDRAGIYMINSTAHIQFGAGTNALRLGLRVNGNIMAWPTFSATINSSITLSKAWRFIVGDQISLDANCALANSTLYGHAVTHYSTVDIAWIAP